MKCMREEADCLAAAAVDKHNFILLVKSIAFRQKVKKHSEEEKISEKSSRLQTKLEIHVYGIMSFIIFVKENLTFC